jgi:hypothetical protein
MDNLASQQPRLDMYAQDLLQQSYQTSPISSDVLNQYGQGMNQQVVQPPALENYAPQQAQMPQQQVVQQASQQQMLQPSRERIAYNKLIEDRFNEIVNYAGGIDRTTKASTIQAFQQKAAADVLAYYGEAPAIQQPEKPLQTREIPGTGKMMVSGAGITSPQFVDVAQSPESAFTAYPLIDSQTGKPIAGKALVNGKIVDVPVDPSVSGVVKLSTGDILNNAVEEMNNLLGPPKTSNETAEQKAERERKEELIADATGKSGNIYQGLSDRLGIPTTASGTRAEIEALKSKVTAIGSSIFAGQGSFSNEERAMIGQALAGINMAGTDEQALRSLRSLQARMIEISNRKKGQGANTIESGQSAVPPKINMDINPATGRFEPIK